MNDRKCGFCECNATMTADTETRREYACPNCRAVELISKGTSWWYHGWKAADGRKLRVPTSEEMWAGIYGWQPST